MKKEEVLQEAKEFKKYWDLLDQNKLSNKHTDDLIKLYNKYDDARNKCTAAILLSHIDNDDKVPATLFNTLQYWNASGYGGWVKTSNSRLFNYYPKYRKEYLEMMFHDKDRDKRTLLAEALFFIQGELREISRDDVKKIILDFIDNEKDVDVKKYIESFIKIENGEYNINDLRII